MRTIIKQKVPASNRRAERNYMKNKFKENKLG